METLKHWSMGHVLKRRAPPPQSGILAGSATDASTVAQLTLFLLWLTSVLLWGVRVIAGRRRRRQHHPFPPVAADSGEDAEAAEAADEPQSRDNDGATRKNAQAFIIGPQDGVVVEGTEANSRADNLAADKSGIAIDGGAGANGDVPGRFPQASGNSAKPTAAATAAATATAGSFSKVKPPPSFDEFLQCCARLGLLLLLFYLCDYRHQWPSGKRQYSRDLFMFLVLLLFAVATAFTVKKTEDKILNRDQTEEWKGWMQVMFVWYHYYHALETYNYIRIFIACYVWMTGFGNFSFFWVRQDFSLWRLLKMLFRLNFLVVLVALVTDNRYMLYYICAMHTYWFLSVYALMATLSSWNKCRLRMAVKLACYFVVNAAIFETPVREVVFRPLWFVLQYQGSLHEWLFRAGLDRYATFVGMLCAYNYPHYERFMNYLDKKHLNRGDYLSTVCIKLFLCGLIGVALAIWYDSVARHEKPDYNALHPYTSWVPVLGFILLRNMFPWLRTHYLGLFAFLGRITLETYIAQAHVYMQFAAKKLIVFVPGYPLMNFALASFVYLAVAHQLFHLTVDISAFLLPKNMRTVATNFVTAAVVVGLHVCFAFLCKEVGMM